MVPVVVVSREGARRHAKTMVRPRGGEMRLFRFGMVIAILFYVTAPAPATAQATAQVTGTVRDASGAVLPGVQVMATQTETGNSRMTVTNETGFYVLPSLLLGPYKIEASLPGCRTVTQSGVW